MFLRYPLAIIAAFATTFGIFFGMHLLVVETEGALQAPIQGGTIEMVRVKRETAPVEKKREMPQKPQTLDEPPPPQMEMSDPGAPGGAAVTVPIAAPTPQAAVKMRGGPNLGAAPVGNAAATPLVRVQPQCTRKMQLEGINGSALVRFDIGPTGQTLNVTLIDVEPNGYGIESNVVRAIERWKYRPKVVDGQGVVQKGLQVKISFTCSK